MNLEKLIIFLLPLLFISCSKTDNKKELVIYTSVDQVFSSKIIKEFEKKIGIETKILYDTEASKAVGLEKRLLAEQKHPKADIFWNSEFMRTARLERSGVFESYKKEINYTKPYYRSKDFKWYGIGLRSRVFVVNKNLIKKEEYPTRLEDLLNPKYKGKVAISMPYFGTTSTHFSALLYKMGEKKFREFINGLKRNRVALLAGNSVVKDAVGRGEYIFGLVDSDDVMVGLEQGLPIDIVFYNQDKDGVFSVFGTVAMLKDAPHQESAKKFIDYLLTKEVEKKLIELKAVQYGILDNSKLPFKSWSIEPLVGVEYLKKSMDIIREIF